MKREDQIALYRTDIQEFEVRISDLQWNINRRQQQIAELEAQDD